MLPPISEMENIRLERGSGTAAVISTFGATLTSWTVDGTELLFVSPNSKFPAYFAPDWSAVMSRYHQVNPDAVFIILFVTEYLLAGADRHPYGAAPRHHPQPDVLQQGLAQPSQVLYFYFLKNILNYMKTWQVILMLEGCGSS